MEGTLPVTMLTVNTCTSSESVVAKYNNIYLIVTVLTPCTCLRDACDTKMIIRVIVSSGKCRARMVGAKIRKKYPDTQRGTVVTGKQEIRCVGASCFECAICP